jgi:hypothetical protein
LSRPVGAENRAHPCYTHWMQHAVGCLRLVRSMRLRSAYLVIPLFGLCAVVEAAPPEKQVRITKGLECRITAPISMSRKPDPRAATRKVAEDSVLKVVERARKGWVKVRRKSGGGYVQIRKLEKVCAPPSRNDDPGDAQPPSAAADAEQTPNSATSPATDGERETEDVAPSGAAPHPTAAPESGDGSSAPAGVETVPEEVPAAPEAPPAPPNDGLPAAVEEPVAPSGSTGATDNSSVDLGPPPGQS